MKQNKQLTSNFHMDDNIARKITFSTLHVTAQRSWHINKNDSLISKWLWFNWFPVSYKYYFNKLFVIYLIVNNANASRIIKRRKNTIGPPPSRNLAHFLIPLENKVNFKVDFIFMQVKISYHDIAVNNSQLFMQMNGPHCEWKLQLHLCF